MLIPIVVSLLVAGCLTPEQKQKNALEDSVIGEYEHVYESGDAHKLIFLNNGFYESYLNGRKKEEFKWSIVNGEIHLDNKALIGVYKINEDKSITNYIMITKENPYPIRWNSHPLSILFGRSSPRGRHELKTLYTYKKIK